MKKYLALLVTLVVALFSANALAYTPPPAPEKGWYVVDQTGRLSASQIQNLNQKIERISKSTKNEFGILLLPNMGGDNIEDVANSTYKAWGVGKRGLDNGCLIVVAIKERKSRIETGKGVEGEVTDLQANDILKKNLNPHLKSGDFYGGFDDTLNALSTLMESRHNQKAEPPPVQATSTPVQPSTQTAPKPSCSIAAGGAGANSGGGFWTILLLLSGFGLVGWYLARRAARRAQEEEAERIRVAQATRDRLARQAADRKEAEERRQRERLANLKTPVVPVPAITRPVAPVQSAPATRPQVPRPTPRPKTTTPAPVVASAGVAAAAALAAAEARQAKLRKEREAEEAEARRRRQRERDEEDRRRRQREEDDRRSSSSSSSYSGSSSSFDWGGSSSGGGSDSGGGFGGGDSGGGGSSSDW